MRKTLVWLFLAAAQLTASVDTEIRQVLDGQVAAWNAGNIREFMAGYEESSSTTFVGKAITKGHANVLARYLKQYPDRAKMGVLRFSDLDIRPLDQDYAVVLGRFHLDRTDAAGGAADGIFSLVFRHTAKGWKIILDHTS